MERFISDFKKYSTDRNWKYGKYTSEFTFQFRIARFLESINSDYLIELESNIERYGYKGLIKKEIDIDIVLSKTKRIAIELKYVRDKGSYNIGMYKYCEDIKFLEELTSENFHTGYAIIFTNIKELYTPKENLNPKNKENFDLYNCFRNKKKLKGLLNIKTGKMNESLKLRNQYNLIWEEFTEEGIMACIVEINKPY